MKKLDLTIIYRQSTSIFTIEYHINNNEELKSFLELLLKQKDEITILDVIN